MRGFNPSVGFVDGVQTADCSYGGWVRVGPNQSYQRCGTILHELLHGCGVIPWADTEWSRHTLRSSQNNDGYGSGYWLGDRVTEVIQFWDNNTDGKLNGDYQHMWPYGINGASEDNGSDLLYIGNSLICQALGEDGLQHTYSLYNEPYYAFNQEDDVKYYIKNESENGGLYTSYLVENGSRQLRWQEMTEEEVLANDSAAWYFTFTPSNQFYQIRNAQTGHNIIYNSSFKMVDLAHKANADDPNINLMRGRVDVAGGGQFKTRGYWFIHPTDNWTPPALTAAAKGVTTSKNFDIKNEATAQRWLILTADEVKKMEQMSIHAARKRFLASWAAYQALLEVPHTQTNTDAEEALRTALSTAQTDAASANSPAALDNITATLKEAAKAFLNGATTTDLTQPFDITCMLNNTDFSQAEMEGWTLTGKLTNEAGVTESQGKAFNYSQDIENSPIGVYEIRVQGFERAGTLEDAYAAYLTGTESNAICYLGTTSNRQPLHTIFDNRQSSPMEESDAQLSDGTYVPTTAAGATARFANGLYENRLVNTIGANHFKVGVRGTRNLDDYWIVTDNFRLYFYGAVDAEALSIDSRTKNQVHNATSIIYDLQGRRIASPHHQEGTTIGASGLPKGVYIINGKKVLVK
jgi:hypothetical protein